MRHALGVFVLFLWFGLMVLELFLVVTGLTDESWCETCFSGKHYICVIDSLGRNTLICGVNSHTQSYVSRKYA